MIKEKAFQLGKALRSGKFKQATRRLRRGTNEFCCLGVACKLDKVKWKNDRKNNVWSIPLDSIFSVTASLPRFVMESFGFFDNVGQRRDGKTIVIDEKEYKFLAHANDNGVTFEKIADYIEENYEQL